MLFGKALLFLGILSLFLLSANSFGQTYYIHTSDSISTCSGTLYDNGGPSANYGPNRNDTITVYADSGSAVVAYVAELGLNRWDDLYI